ncbi:MAG: lysozyme inhibitor LprI family protein [Betaproteobacteria bacterium]
MKKLFPLLALLALLSAAVPALAQYAGPAVQACRAYAEAEVRKGGAGNPTVRIDAPGLDMQRYTRKVGSQFVSSLLSGEGAIVYAQGVPVEFSFVCLLADEKRPVFFYWIPRLETASLGQCRRSTEVASCLDSLLIVAEQELTMRYSGLFVDAREADARAGNENQAGIFRRSSEAYLAYRAAECARRGAAGSEPHKACMVDLTRRRALDLR